MGKLKKVASFLLILILALGFFQPVSAEENNSVTVGIRLETMTDTMAPLTYITMPETHKTFEAYGLSGQAETDFYTPIHVLAQYYSNMGVSAEQMNSMIGISNNFVNTIGGKYANGDTKSAGTYSWMYMVNDAYPASGSIGYMMNDCPLKNGDIITVYGINYYATTYYAYFQQQKLEVRADEPATLTLLGKNYMAAGGEPVKISGATLISSANGSSTAIPTESVTDNNGQASITFSEPGVYTISASKASEISRPFAQITVTPSDDEQDKVLAASDKIALSIASETAVNISLPDKGASGKTRITWSSSDPSIIRDDGKIIWTKEAKTAKLTATIKKGLQTETKDFPITVQAVTALQITQALDVIKMLLSDSDNMEAGEGTDTNLVTKMQALADEIALGSTITLTDISKQPQVGANGAITYGSKDADGEVSFKIGLLGNEAVGSVMVSIPAHVMTAQEVVDDDAEKITWDSIKKDNNAQSNVVSNLSLKAKGASGDTDITWETSDASVITKSGLVSRPAYSQGDTTVTLSATVAPGHDMNGAAEGKKASIEVTVKAHTLEENDAGKGDVEKVKNYLLNECKIKKIDTDKIADLSNIDYDLQLQSNNTKTTGASDVKVDWSSTNSGITVNYLRGKVTRPGINGDKTAGKLTATISKNGYKETLDFDTIVLPLSQAEIEAENAAIKKIAADLTFDKIKKDNIRSAYVTSNLQMVYRGYCDGQGTVSYGTKNSGESGIKITWETNMPNYIATYGTVTRRSADTDVSMTATISSIVLKDVAGVTSQKVIIPVTVIKPTPKLGNITLSAGDLAFTPDTYAYSVEIPEGVTETTLALTKFDSAAKVEVTGATTDKNGNYQSKLDSVVTIKSTLKGDSVEYKIDFATKDQVAARGVVDKIIALSKAGELTIADKSVVEAARTAYDGLTDAQKFLVTNSKTLTDAEEKMAKLAAEEANATAAKTVVNAIAGLPAPEQLTLSNKADVIAVRNAYKTLTDTQKAMVNNLAVLEAAEKQIIVLETPAPTPVPTPTPTPKPEPGTAKDDATGIEVIGLPEGVGLKVEPETGDAGKTDEAEKAAIEAGIKDAKVVSLYSIKPDMNEADLAKFNSDPDSFVTLTMPLSEDQQGYDNYKIYHKKTDGTVEWITPTLSADGKSLIFKVSAFSEFGVVGTNSSEDPEEPGQPGFIAFLGKDTNGIFYEYNAIDLNNAYLACQINSALPASGMYQQFLNSKCKMAGLKDGVKGYMDYSAASNASLTAQMKGQSFDINAYFSGNEAKLLAETVDAVKVVDKEGHVK